MCRGPVEVRGPIPGCAANCVFVNGSKMVWRQTAGSFPCGSVMSRRWGPRFDRGAGNDWWRWGEEEVVRKRGSEEQQQKRQRHRNHVEEAPLFPISPSGADIPVDGCWRSRKKISARKITREKAPTLETIFKKSLKSPVCVWLTVELFNKWAYEPCAT